MRILHITNNFPTDNYPIFGIFVKEQIDSLSSIGVDNSVFFINGRELGKLEYIKSIWKIRKILKSEQFDLIHCHHALSAICLILSAKSKNNKVLISFQNDPVNELGKRIFKYVKNNTDGWIFKNNSTLIRDEYSFYLPNGVNTKFFLPMDRIIARQQLNLNFEKIYILFVSSNFIRKQKRLDKFKETLNILRNKYNYKDIEEILLINKKREIIPSYFNAVNIHLLTSDFEGSPNSVKESMACNTPVVSTNVGNVFELLRNVKGSYVAKKDSAEELANLVDLALKNKSSNSRKELIRLKMDIESVAVKLINIYTKIIQK